MVSAYWGKVLLGDRSVPTDRPLADLTAELTQLLGDPDPRAREGLAYPTLCAWIDRGEYDDLLSGLGDGMAAGMRRGIGESGTHTVYRRSWSARVLGRCIVRDTERSLVPAGKVLEWGDRLATWLLAEDDLRAFVPGEGWAHALAHGADALAALAGSPHVGPLELQVVLDVIAERLARPTPVFLNHGEPDRLAEATMRLLRRDAVAIEALEPWVARLGELARPRDEAEVDSDPYLGRADAEAFLRALYLRLAIAPRPPAVRADLMLLLVEELRSSNPDDLGLS